MIGVIWKFPLTDADNVIDIPGLIELVHVGRDPSGAVCLWCFVDPEGRERRYRVRVVCTGETFAAQNAIPLGTIVDGPLVLHVLNMTGVHGARLR